MRADRRPAVPLRDLLGLSDGNLSHHLMTLEKAGYVKTTKSFEGRKPRTWITATPAGRKALANEIAALRDIVTSADAAAIVTSADAAATPEPLQGRRLRAT